MVLTFLPASYTNLRRLMMPRAFTVTEGRPVDWHCPRDYSLLRTESSSDAVLPSDRGRRPSSPREEGDSVKERSDFQQLGSARSEPILPACADLEGGLATLRRQLSVEQCNADDSTAADPRGLNPPGASTPDDGRAAEVAQQVEKASITLPVYVYDAPVSAVINRLVHIGGVRRWKDTYLDLTSKDEEKPENRPEGAEGKCHPRLLPHGCRTHRYARVCACRVSLQGCVTRAQVGRL